MRDWINKITIAILGIVLAACGKINEYGNCPSFDEPHHVNFVLAIDSPSTSRATWEDSESTDELGTGFENRIMPSNLRVAIFTTDNQHIGDVEALEYWPIGDNRYQFNGKVPVALLESVEKLGDGELPEYKFMVYANCDNGDNDSIMFGYEDLEMTSGAIPMWGVKQVNITDLINNRVQQLGVISLLRAVAKVEVIVDDALVGCTINSATINYHNRSGYVLPTGWDSATSTTSMDRDNIFRGYRSLHTTPHELIEIESGRKYVIYLPEYDNNLFSDYESKISVDVTYNSREMSFPDALQFREYIAGEPSGEPSNIVRNTIYRFRITKVDAGGIVLGYDVNDWELGDSWKWEQTFDYPNYHNPVLPDTASRDGDSSNDIYPDRPEMRYVSPGSASSKDEGAFSCWFQMVSPTGQRWLPTLHSASSNCDIVVYKEVDMTMELVYSTSDEVTASELKDGSKLIAYDGWYNIKVIPTDPSYTGIARFGITYTQDWMGVGSRYLLINGEEGHIVWPNSGSEPRIIDIQQVSN